MFGEFENEDEYLMSLKQDDSYHFTIPFEYIEKNYGDDQYDIATTNMEVDVEWSESERGYRISYYAPEEYLIDPVEGNGDIDEIYEYSVEPIVLQKLDSMGITSEARVGGTGVW